MKILKVVSLTAVALAYHLASAQLSLASSECDTVEAAGASASHLHVCQPKEYKGSYGVRDWKADISTVCGYEKEETCVTLDAMNCDGSPGHCLKWGNHAYAGQVILPNGIEMDAWGSWNCGGPPRSEKTGTAIPKSHNIWDFNWRINAFKFKTTAEFKCEAGPSGNYALVSQCGKGGHEVRRGRWVYLWEQGEGNEGKQTVITGRDVKHEHANTKEWQNAISEAFKVGYTMEWGPGEGTGEVTLTGTHATGGSAAVAHAITDTTKERTENKFDKPGAIWQFVAAIENDSVPVSSGLIRTRQYQITPSQNQPPCCPPGNFVDINKPNGACRSPEHNLCTIDEATINNVVRAIKNSQ